MFKMMYLSFALATAAMMSSSSVEATDFMDGVVPESTFVETEVLNPPTSTEAIKDFKQDGLDGGIADLEKQAGSEVSSQPLNATNAVLRIASNMPHEKISMEEYPKHVCEGRNARGKAKPPNSYVVERLQPYIEAFDRQLDPLCSDPQKNGAEIRSLTRGLESQVKTIRLNPPPEQDLSDDDLAALGHIEEISDPAERIELDRKITQYCKHGSYAKGIRNALEQPVLDKLQEGVSEMDECMQCVCTEGQDACSEKKVCQGAIEHLSDIGGDIMQAKGFKDSNGNLIQELGPQHAQAIHKIVNHVAKKKKQLHARHGAEPTKEQFFEVFSTNDLSEQTLVQVQGCHGMSAATAMEFRSGAIGCGFDCNEYNGGEVSLSCTAFEVVTVEIGVTFQPLTMYLKLKLCAPGVSDVIGEIQKIPVVDTILSKFGIDGGCLLLGKGYIDFTNGIGEILPGPNGLISLSFLVAKAKLEARAFFRFDSALPKSNPWSQDCHKNQFISRYDEAVANNFKAGCDMIVPVLSQSLKPLLPQHPQCRDYSTCPQQPDIYRNRGSFGLMVPQPLDWFGIRAGVTLEVFCPCGWPWNWGYKVVYSKVFFKNNWKTGNY